MKNTNDESVNTSDNSAKRCVVSSAFMVLRGKVYGNVFWTTGGDYDTDWYELVFQSDDEEEIKRRWSKELYGL